ncbi:MAG: aldehyde ferredoxin oxidoreductase family protein [Candidatus Heimdallarchaeota archaeon]
MYGYMGKILRVNLTSGTITEEFPDKQTLRNFLGGAGLATKYLYEEVPPNTDPLGPDNKLIFMTGPLTGTPSPSTGRFSVVTKSPLTGLWGQANSGGFWGRDLKRAGFDGIIFEGMSENPVMLVLDEGNAELRDASHLWGKITSETTKTIQEELGNDFNVACIGPAGENLVKYAAIMNDVKDANWGRAAGRCGVGTVMGSKRVKAIACRGKIKINVAEQEIYRKEAKKRVEWVNQSLLKMTLEVYGTAGVLDLVNQRGGFPTRNWQLGVNEHSEEINGEAINENILVERKACYACPIACGRISDIQLEGMGKKERGESPEYEALGALGSMCMVHDLEVITKAQFLCNEYGLDIISAGGTIAFAMEAFERGILSKEKTGNLEIGFGDGGLVLDLLHKIAYREGIGDFLAEGSRLCAQELGNGAERFAMNVKGLELPAYDPRASKVTGLAYAVANRGGDHMTAFIEGPAFLSLPFLIVEDAELGDDLTENTSDALVLKQFEDAFQVFDALSGCKFMGMVLTGHDWAVLISTLLGEDFSEEDFRKTGERIYNLERLWNNREGLTRAEDTLPTRLLEDPLSDGPAQGQVVNLEPLLDAYYQYRGWNNNGIPTVEKLQELDLEWADLSA